MLKGGIFGFGETGLEMVTELNIDKWHGDDVRIVAVCNRGKPRRDLAEQQYNLAAYEKIDDLIAHGIDFMLILSNSYAHHDAAMACIKAGIPYLIEKPITLTLEDAAEIVQATEEAGLINCVNYSMRYKPIFIKMKQMVDDGELGDVLSLWARSFRGYGFYGAGKRHRAICEPEESGGWIIHHMCHITDFAVWIAGQIDEVYTVTSSTAPAKLDSEEIIFSTVKFANGAIGTLSDQVGILRDHSAGVTGTKGGISEIIDGVKPLIKYRSETDDQFGPTHIIDPEDSIKREFGLAHFVRCLREGKPTRVPVSEAYYSLKVCHAMRRSAHEGKAVKID